MFFLLLGLAFAEAAFFLGFVLPGETALVLGGALCATGVFPLAAFLPAAIIAAIVGDSVGYEVGKRLGPRIRTTRVGRRIGDQRWGAAEWIFDRHGGKAVFFGRAQAVLRALVPALAGEPACATGRSCPGTPRVPSSGAAAWSCSGYVFAHSLSALETGLKYWGIAVLVVSSRVGLLVIRSGRRAEREAEARRTRRRDRPRTSRHVCSGDARSRSGRAPCCRRSASR